MTTKPRVAFDLDDTLGGAIIHELSNEVVWFQLRPGCLPLLDKLVVDYTLCLWTISSRWYLDKVLTFGLGDYFSETYSWDELPGKWKDIRRIGVNYLIDDDPNHRESASKEGLAEYYIIVPAFGSPEDDSDPQLWIREVEHVLITA